jgi:uncharacterized metal-binding protein
MVELPKKKVGIVACSGEELAEGTVTRLAALKVLEQLRPSDTVTICLPLFLAGGEGDRAFARFYPTIAVDGCELRCAARGTEMYSGKPAASVVVTDILKETGEEPLSGCRRLNTAGLKAVDATAEKIANLVDELLDKRWSRRSGEFVETGARDNSPPEEISPQKQNQAICSCGSGIPLQDISINGKAVTVVGLPVIFEQMKTAGRSPNRETADEILETVKIYNPVPADQEEDFTQALLSAYGEYFREDHK